MPKNNSHDPGQPAPIQHWHSYSEPGPHDLDILTLVANRQPIATIYEVGKGRWDSAETAWVLLRHNLTVVGGSIVRADVAQDSVLDIGLVSTNHKVRNQAIRIQQQLIELAVQLGAEYAQFAAHRVRQAMRDQLGEAS